MRDKKLGNREGLTRLGRLGFTASEGEAPASGWALNKLLAEMEWFKCFVEDIDHNGIDNSAREEELRRNRQRLFGQWSGRGRRRQQPDITRGPRLR